MTTTFATRSLQLFAAAILAAAATPVYAQTDEMTATVPFDFVVGTAHLPAGTYMVRPGSEDRSTIMLQSTDGRAAAIVLTIPQGAPNLASSAKPGLTFQMRGAEHVLAGVVEGDGTGREIVLPHAIAERASAAEGGR